MNDRSIRHTCLLFELAIAILFMGGCNGHGTYTLVVENHSTQTVVLVGGEGSGGYMTISPCAIRQGIFLGPFYGVSFEVTLKNDKEKILQKYKIKGKRDRSGHWPVIVLVYPREDSSNCMQPVHDLYYLTISNKTDESLAILHDGQTIGEWEPGGSRRVGPFKGSVYDTSPLMIVGPDGENRVGADLTISRKFQDVEMGQVPCLDLAILKMPGTPPAAGVWRK